MNDIWNIKILTNIFKTVFVSLEFLFAIIMFGIYFLFDFIPFDEIGVFFFKDNEIVKWITFGLPATMFGFSLRYQKVLLEPESNNKILYDWPEYKQYMIATYIAIIFCLLPLPVIIMSLIRLNAYREYDLGFYYILLNGISFISLGSLYISHFKIKRILQQNS